MKSITKYIEAKRLSPTNSSVHYEDTTRFMKAVEQASLKPTDINKVISLTKEFLTLANLKMSENPLFQHIQPEDYNQAFYEKLQSKFKLSEQEDIVWMKFTKDGFLGVVATSNIINFNIPSTADEYNDLSNGNSKSSTNVWKYNTAGIILHHLKKEWNEEFVLIFPLTNIPANLSRSKIKCGIGNYLIENEVPILDYYSHNF